MGFRRALALALLWAVAALAMPTAGAYEFEVRAKTVGQGNSLRSLRFLGPDQILARRRFSQTLQLHIWDLAGKRDRLRPY
jgi:hypothetical protein